MMLIELPPWNRAIACLSRSSAVCSDVPAKKLSDEGTRHASDVISKSNVCGSLSELYPLHFSSQTDYTPYCLSVLLTGLLNRPIVQVTA